MRGIHIINQNLILNYTAILRVMQVSSVRW